MTNREIRIYRAKIGVCTTCGGELDTVGKTCSKCRELANKKNKERREYYLSNGICPYCGTEKLFGSERSCPECRAKRMDASERSQKKRWNIVLEQSASSHRKKYHERKEQGLCARCGKREFEKGTVLCWYCRNQRIRYDNEKRERRGIEIPRNERVAHGLCYTCGNPLDRDGRICISCADTMTKNLPEDRGGNVYWRQQNKRITYKIGG